MIDQPKAAAVTLRGVEKWFDDVPAVRAFDLEIAAGELVVLLGPSGCGKTTVLRTIAGLEEPSAGEIRIGTRAVNDVEPADRDIAMVFQNYALYPHMTVRQNLGFGLRMRGLPRPEVAAKVVHAAAVLGLEPLLDRRPGQLSGGQRQRVALGRALVREPRVFLFDEPLSNLDARLRLEMRAEIAQLHRRLGITMIFVTHDQVEAMTLGQRIAVMKGGTLQQFATPLEVYRSPTNLFVATFIGSPPINTTEGELLPGEIGSVFQGNGLLLDLPTYAYSGAAVLGVRPEALSLTTTVHEVDFTAEIVRLESLGNESLVHLAGPGTEHWVSRVDPEYDGTAGDQVGVRVDRTRVHVFAGPERERLIPEHPWGRP